ncbi:hypothetical protein TNCV_1628811 [Trichonephila clavipes]|nr:hypothetical protein TNCV_1628811 [Trichonephila clavipes]
MRINAGYCMKDVTFKFIKRMGIIPEGDIFQISPKRKILNNKSGKRVGQSPLEMTRSSKNSVKTSILTRDTDGLFNGLFCKVISTSGSFVFITNALPDRFLSVTYPVQRNRCTKSVIIDAYGAVSPGYFC